MSYRQTYAVVATGFAMAKPALQPAQTPAHTITTTSCLGEGSTTDMRLAERHKPLVTIVRPIVTAGWEKSGKVAAFRFSLAQEKEGDGLGGCSPLGVKERNNWYGAAQAAPLPNTAESEFSPAC